MRLLPPALLLPLPPVLSGRKDIFLDGEKYTLEEGDSITFSSDTPHWYKNSYEEVCVAIWVNAPHAW